MENNENMVEFISGTRSATVTFTNQKHINRMKKLYEERGSEFKYFVENEDGSICAKIPLKWIKVNPGSVLGTRAKREMTEDQKEALRQRLAAGRAKKKAKK
jgi:hypothetical protein